MFLPVLKSSEIKTCDLAKNGCFIVGSMDENPVATVDCYPT